MAKISRAEFLGLSGVLGAAFGYPGGAIGETQAAAASLATEPDLAVVNARVYTVDESLSRAEAFAVKNGRFIAVGSSSDIKNLASRRTELVDAQQMTVLPGFIDTHCHPSGINELYEVNANVRTLKELQHALRRPNTNHWTALCASVSTATRMHIPPS
jgi:predicted amidohydrolase YtcJ